MSEEDNYRPKREHISKTLKAASQDCGPRCALAVCALSLHHHLTLRHPVVTTRVSAQAPPSIFPCGDSVSCACCLRTRNPMRLP